MNEIIIDKVYNFFDKISYYRKMDNFSIIIVFTFLYVINFIVGGEVLEVSLLIGLLFSLKIIISQLLLAVLIYAAITKDYLLKEISLNINLFFKIFRITMLFSLSLEILVFSIGWSFNLLRFLI